MSIHRKFLDTVYEHPAETLGVIVAVLLLLFATFGCAIKPADVDSWTDEAQAQMIQFQGRVSQAVQNFRNESLQVTTAINEKVDEVNATVDAIQNGVKAAGEATSEMIENALLLFAGGAGGAGGLFGAGKLKRRNGSG